ncbi:MAG: hypothetical protein ABUL54_09160 [Dongia sp.]
MATSAMPIGIPGCPLLAFSTASIANARIAFAMSLWLTAPARSAVSGAMGDFCVQLWVTEGEHARSPRYGQPSDGSSMQPDAVLTRSAITGLIQCQRQETRVGGGPQTEAAILSMSRLETAMNRLDAAMARLDAAVSESAERGDQKRTSMEQELAALRETHELLQDEARLVSDRLDLAVGRLQTVMAGSH